MIETTEHRPESVEQLPDPDQRAQADLVIFDGECKFCRTQVGRLAKLDWWQQLAFLPLQDPRVTERYKGLTREDLMAQMYVIEPGGARHGGADALRYLSRQIPALWPLAPLLHLPGTAPVWHWLYHQVAKRRYLFGRVQTCENGVCQVHFPTNPPREED